MSQETLAARAGITQTQLSRLERNLSAPRYSTIYRLARELDVTPEYLTGREYFDLEEEDS
jgi:transcriptional regulator with XRE-family HTH domain